MKKQATLFRNALSLTLLIAPIFAHGQSSSMPGYLADYQYQVTNLSSYSEAQALMDLETPNTSNNSICSSRAEVWTYMMNRTTQAQVGKVFIHFTAQGEASENAQWAYHVAPYVMVNGEEVVLDRAFNDFHQKPTTLANWSQHFGKSQHCVVLDPVNNPAHLKLEQNDLPADWLTPLTYKKGPARQYPSTEGICYIRKVPMYYGSPKDVYAADLALAGRPEYRKFIQHSFNTTDVMDSCKQALTIKARMSQSCASYLGLPN